MSPIGFAAIGFAHNHIFNLVDTLLAAGGQLISFYDTEPPRIAEFAARYPQAAQAPSISAILEDARIGVVVSAAIPIERAPLGIQVMQHGKDFLVAKPGVCSLEQLAQVRDVQEATQRKYTIYYSERLQNPATLKAGELVERGAIGQVVQTVGFGPHRLLGQGYRPAWAFERPMFGGILNDLASHQIDQFLYFTGSPHAEIVSAHVGNFHHPQFPNMHDFGDLTLRSARAVGHIRVDWLTPNGLDSWGDVRLFIVGTDGMIELRKNIDLAGRVGGNHLYLVTQSATQYIPCDDVPLTFGAQFLADVRQRTERALSQAHVFRVAELALQAEQQAVILA